MNEQKLLAILAANPWQTTGQLVKLALSQVGAGVKDPEAYIKSLIKDARAKLQTTGQKRGTRYALAGAPLYVEQVLDVDLTSRVLAAVNAGKSKSAEIEKALGADISAVREALRALLEREAIEATGNKRSRAYWPLGKAPTETRVSAPAQAETISVERKPSPSFGSREWSEGIERASDKPEAPSAPLVTPISEEILPRERAKPSIPILEAAHIILSELPRRKVLANRIERNVFTTDALANRMCERWGYARYHTGQAIVKAVREQKTIMHHQYRYKDGWHLDLWRPENDSEPKPTLYQGKDESLATMDSDDSEPSKKVKRK